MTYLTQNSNSVIDFRLDRHIKSISGSTGSYRGRTSTRANHCAVLRYTALRSCNVMIYVLKSQFDLEFNTRSQSGNVHICKNLQNLQCIKIFIVLFARKIMIPRILMKSLHANVSFASHVWKAT